MASNIKWQVNLHLHRYISDFEVVRLTPVPRNAPGSPI